MIRTEAPAGEATQVLGTSLRAVPVETTLALAEAWAPRLGITRVTDITRLDRIGIPVFASIRPGAQRGSLCVNAGKGLTPEEARAGATMEAIEFALAEHGASAVEVVAATARDVIDGRERSDAVLDFCPVMGARIPLDEPLACVEAEELVSGGTCLVPAELVFLPAPRSLIPRQYFGPSSNALSSGNTVEEATVHALTEIIERDVLSFHSFRDETRLVREETLPARARELADAIRRAGLRLYVRYCPNAYAVPWFSAILVDPEESSPVFVNGGYGCHPHRAIAAARAITEAVQGRLAFIHGGRDDLVRGHKRYERLSDAERRTSIRQRIESAARADRIVSFDEITDHAPRAPDLPSALGFLMETLVRAGFRSICRVVYTAPSDPLQAVRILVPGAEMWLEGTGRVGRRLRDFVREHAQHPGSDPIRRPQPAALPAAP